MTERQKPIMLPSKKEYSGPLAKTTESLENMKARISAMSALDTQTALSKYAGEDFMPANENTNMLEMSALYQRALTLLGVPVGVDGFFGAKTQKAIQEFQKANGLVADGIPGKLTTTKLLSKLSEKIPRNNQAKEALDALEALKITEQDSK